MLNGHFKCQFLILLCHNKDSKKYSIKFKSEKNFFFSILKASKKNSYFFFIAIKFDVKQNEVSFLSKKK